MADERRQPNLERLLLESDFGPGQAGFEQALHSMFRWLHGAAEITSNSYGWVQLSAFINHHAMRETAIGFKGNYQAVDLCSALPVWATYLRAVLPAYLRETPFKVTSVDIEEPQKLLESGANSFSREFKRTRNYHEALKLQDHVHDDIFNLDFPDESISLVTSMEGFPFHFGDPENLDPAKFEEFARKVAKWLRPGGMGVFFPWCFKDDNQDKHKVLTNLEKVWSDSGLNVQKVRFTWNNIMDLMGPQEELLTFRSAMFTEYDYRRAFPSLEISKPPLPTV